MNYYLVIKDREFEGYTVEATDEAEARIELDNMRETRFELVKDHMEHGEGNN